ncbi:MAG: alkaline phosphatase D family protein [Bacteroidales bacterium]|nr:alkaline phosphatase D family protein [Bacteroidales bacterium]
MRKYVIWAFYLLASFSCSSNEEIEPAFVLLAGELTSEGAILQCRFAASDTLIGYDMPGVDCKGYFEISPDSLFRNRSVFGPFQVTESNDFIIRKRVLGLDPDRRYFYRAKAVIPDGTIEYSRTGLFRTLPLFDAEKEIRFAIATGFNYEHYYGLDTSRNRQFRHEPRMLGAVGEDSIFGFEAFETVMKISPDFFIANGDVVYYDKPSSDPEMWARSMEEMQAKWHRYFSMPRNREMCLEVPVYFLKDDHDHRYNDCDTTDERGSEPSSKLGIEVFKQQVPVTDPLDENAKTYRTIRMGKHLQVWFMEGRDYRSPNSIKDTIGKTIWGEEQKNWLMQGLLESDATYKIMISPTPMVGPDDAYKKDNHTNPGGFRTERDEFFCFLKENGLIGNGFYIICGDRHWQYHSIAPNGLEEFSCGAFIDQNSRAGRLPGDPLSTDPDAELTMPYVQTNDWGGGFLLVSLQMSDDQSYLKFSFRNKYGEPGYEITRRRTINN